MNLATIPVQPVLQLRYGGPKNKGVVVADSNHERRTVRVALSADIDVRRPGDHRYRAGFVIESNPDAVKGAGSCIFAHLWKAPGAPTAGCTAMADATMERLYGWLRPQAQPVFVLLPEAEYDRLQASWHLPVL